MQIGCCCFKLSGQNEQSLNFQTRFSQIGLRLNKKWTEQKLLRISSELIWCNFFSEILNQNFTPKWVILAFSNNQKLRWNYSVKWIDKTIISQEASYAAQQCLRRVKSSKTSKREKIFIW